MLSFWEQHYFTHYDYIIIGGGITGLSAACSLMEKSKNARVLVVERGIFPTGASTKNAGFACIGSLTEKLADLELMGEDAFLNLIENRWKGLYMLRKRLGDNHIDYQNNGGFELIRKNDSYQKDKMEYMNKLLMPIFIKPVFAEFHGAIDLFGFNKDMLTTCLFNGQEGQVNTALMMRTLYNYAGMLQIKMLSGAEVEHLEEFADYTEVHLKEPISKGVIKLHAKKIAVCTNAFTAKFFPEIDITPGRGQVLCTKPIEGLKVKGVFSFDEGYYYFRNFESRIILGGGRNLDFEEETTTDFGITQKIQQQLEFYLEEMIVPGKTVHIDSRWSGIMAFGKDKQPLLKKMGNSLFLAARLNGMGIALGSKIGDDISTMMLED